MARKHPKHLWIAFLIIIAIIILQNVILLTHQPNLTGHVSSGEINLCINGPPTVNLSACSQTAFTNISYTCIVNATDQQQSSFAYAVSRLSGPAAGDPLFVMTGDNLTFTAAIPQIGNYTLRFLVDDLSGCLNDKTYTDFNLTINLSSNAPYLVTPLPNETWDANTLLIAFDLDDYFADPNGDPLVYAGYNNTNVRIDIVAGEVLLTPALNWCGTEYIYFIATDPTNLTGQSNTIKLTVNCVSQQSQSSSSTTSQSSAGGSRSGGASGGASGGGGGGARASRAQCVEDYTCFDWSTCQLTRVVDPDTGNSGTITITGVLGSRTFEVDPDFQADPNAFYEGYQYRECLDTRECDNAKTRVYVRTCSYKPSCSDNIQNQGETAVDCGGPLCAACSTCTDGIQNGKEEAVDCGGPLCPACNTCTDGKINGKELGLDCGGPDCPVCATCFDEIQNQDETGVDCGGLFCKACGEEESPEGVPFPWLTVTLLAIIGLILCVMFYAAIKRHIAALLMKFFFRHKKTNRVILIPTSSKDEIIRRLAELEMVVPKQPALKSQEQLAGIIRDYFKEAFKLDFEFTNEELLEALRLGKLNPLLNKILLAFFTRINALEFSGVSVQPLVLTALIQETRAIVYQTAVLTVDDLKAAEADIEVEQVARDAPSMDRAYLLLHQLHLALQLRKNELSAALYQVLYEWYSKASPDEQRVFYGDLTRVYDEYCLASGAKVQAAQAKQ